MEVANPIYDAVFKFLLQDTKIAKLVLGTMIGHKIEELELRPTELPTVVEGRERPPVTVYRLDFAARIRQDDGTTRLILLEIQKAKLHTDILRFRRYLGKNYLSGENYEEVSEPKTGILYKKALPIYTIYLLGHLLDHNRDEPVIRLQPTRLNYAETSNGKPLEDDEFIRALNHDCTILQIPALKKRRRNRLEILLNLFDQAQVTSDSTQVIEINEEEYPAEFRPIIRRLLMAIADKKIRQKMVVEDEFTSELESFERREEQLRKLADDERRQKEDSQRREENERRQKEDSQRREENERRQKEEALRRVEQAKEKLRAKGISAEDIADMLSLND